MSTVRKIKGITAAGSRLLPVGFWATSGSIAGHTVLTRVMSRLGILSMVGARCVFKWSLMEEMKL